MGLGVLVMLAAMSTTSCAPAAAGRTAGQTPPREIVLKLGASERVADIGATVVFEAVVEDSRCPTGVTCVREGDAAIKIKVTWRDATAASYTLHTSDRLAREIEHGTARVRLVAVAPHPKADAKISSDDYRITLAIIGK